jgi:adenosylcobalamin-dependent ribonucleoside-triphosphate reductase
MIMARELYPGMGQAVAERTILRKKNKGTKRERWETWEEVSERVAQGNALLCPTAKEKASEYRLLNQMIGNGSLLTSGRHLQHGDVTEPMRNMEVFTNCSTAITTFGLVYLLLNGSGVGRCYDDDLMLVDWDNAPNILCVLDESHPDFDPTAHESARDAYHKYRNNSNVLLFKVGDSREGWGSAVEYLELLAFEKIHHDKLLILDFSQVRCKNTPIAGMQDRPCSGPVPLMNAFMRVNSLKGAGMPRWMQAMYVDHYFADCVLVGGVRRSARMSVKNWRDPSIFEFIQVKRPIEFYGKTPQEIAEIRATSKPNGFLWSSNNSVMVDEEFWELVRLKPSSRRGRSSLARHARKVFEMVTQCAYYDGTGEPGIINVDKLTVNNDEIESIKGEYFNSKRYNPLEGTSLYLDKLLKAAKSKQYCMIVNPCSEICIAIWGAFCTIADVCFYHCDNLGQCEEVIRAAVRFLIRVNTLDSVYNKEVKRTNRIGVGLTGVHEAAWKFFGFDFFDLINEQKSKEFWLWLSKMKRAVRDESIKYSKYLGVKPPHTDTTVKPSGTISKLFGLTEGWHLPAMLWYIRWVQFSLNNPLVAEYKAKGYPVQELKKYRNTVIVGFPTVPLIATIMPADRIVTAAQATPEQQYKWLMLGEKYWIRGVDEQGNPLNPDTGNQISYTLKYDPKRVMYKEFRETILKYQSKVRCCSIMPQEEQASYEYLPEQPVAQAIYNDVVSRIKAIIREDIGREHLDCGAGGCPVDFTAGEKK